ncbi:MAG: hypothetical protein JW740_03460 [Candidatus Zambryskibacteria bacterium]|nr:hypothetical protein [Candidatus Zambryskibacteria bacterium]
MDNEKIVNDIINKMEKFYREKMEEDMKKIVNESTKELKDEIKSLKSAIENLKN